MGDWNGGNGVAGRRPAAVVAAKFIDNLPAEMSRAEMARAIEGLVEAERDLLDAEMGRRRRRRLVDAVKRLGRVAAAEEVGAGGHAARLECLTPCELELMPLIAAGLTGEEIGAKLKRSKKTIESRVGSMAMKLKLPNGLRRVQLAVLWARVEAEVAALGGNGVNEAAAEARGERAGVAA